MIPREHLPLTLVTFALVGLMFLLYREISAVKTAVAQLSVPAIQAAEDDADDDSDDEADAANVVDVKPSGSALGASRAPGASRSTGAARDTSAVRATGDENRENAPASENAVPRVTKAIANSSSKESALKLRK